MVFFKLLFLSALAMLALPARSDVVATVNGEPLDRQEVEALAAQALLGVQDESARHAVLRQTLETLVSERLFAQAAKRAGLEQDETVRSDLGDARREAVTNAFIGDLLRRLPPVSEQQIDRYIASHPKHFAARQTYHYQRLALPPVDGLDIERVREAIRTHKTIDGLRAWARRQGWLAELESRWQGAEQIDAGQLARLETMRAEELAALVDSDSGQVIVLQRKGAWPDPVDPARVRGAVALGVAAEVRNEAVRSLVANLRAQADIVVPALGSNDTVVATVNGTTIERAAVERVLRRRAVATPTARLRQQIVDDLIDAVLLHEAALSAPPKEEVRPTLAEARALRLILAAAYLDRVLLGVAAPEQREINRLVGQRPLLFGERQVFRFQQTVLLPTAVAASEEIRSVIATGMSGTRLDAWLTGRGWVAGRGTLWRGPEQVDRATLDALVGMADGETRVVVADPPRSVLILQRIAAYPDPLDLDQASSLAAQALLAQRRAEATGRRLAELRSAAQIVVTADFVGSSAQPPRPALLALWTSRHWSAFSNWILLAALIPLLPAALAWFVVRTRRRTVFTLAFPEQLSWRDRFSALTHSGPFLLVAGGFLALAIAGAGAAQWLLLRGQIAPDRVIIATVVGLLAACVLAGGLLLGMQRVVSPIVGNRWWPLLGLLGAQAGSLFMLRWSLS